ncbi:phosphatase PAP2 family protein [Nafulsella turpanensis]|uniref:phosphatase PAP2 family protein n=1 Tax=Nafulsella turpanensis TaxID=1265690 RepID=UPI00034D26F1|nr:phosphatase PAP2 family protein [Nafulsella turpanensis]
MQVNFNDLARSLRKLYADFYESYHSYLGLLLGILLSLLMGAFLVNAFGELLEELRDKELVRFDTSVAGPVHALRSDGLTNIMLVVTWMGDRTAYIIFGVLLFIIFYLRYRSFIFPLQTSMVLLVAGGLNRWLKSWINRPRPAAEHLAEAGNMSFPSGHSMSAIAFYGFLIYLVWRLVDTTWLRWTLSILLSILILSIGLSRVYLGVHYPSDVLAGFAAGGACLAVFIAIFTFVRFHYARKGKEPQVTADEQS